MKNDEIVLTLNNQESKINEFVDKCITNNIKINISYNNLNSLFDNKFKKKIFTILDPNSSDYSLICSKLLPDMNLNKNKYLLNYDEMKYFKKITEKFYSNKINLLNDIEPFNFTRFSDISKLNNIVNIFDKFRNDNKISFKHNESKLKKLGFYILPKNVSPGFKNFRAIIPYLAKEYDLYLFLDNDNSLNDTYDEIFFKNVNVFYVNNLNSNDLYNLIKSKDINVLIYIYGFYKRKELVIKKPCPIQINFQEPPVIYPNFCYDYNLIDINLFNILKNYSNLDFNLFNFICLKKNFILPIPFYSNYNNTFIPNLKHKNFNIGIIAYDPKLCHKFINLINEILDINDNITFTIYGNISDQWFEVLFENNNRIKKDLYNNKNPYKLLNHFLFIDTINYNNHSTALEILKLKIPFIGYTNYKRYNACFSQSLMKSIKMDDILLADSKSKMINLITKFINDKKFYLNMCQKLSTNIDNYFNYQYYSSDFIETLNSFYQSLNN